jgi:DNA-binding XRE family transcriptional regulator
MNEPQIIRSPSGEEMVIIPRAEYEALVAAARNEDEDDIAVYDARKAELAASGDGLLPQSVSEAMLRGDSLLRALRRWRHMSQCELAAKAKVGQGYISDLESRRRAGALETLRRLAQALDVPAKWLG